MNKGLIIKSTGKIYQVLTPDGATVACKISGKFRNMGIKTTNPIAVGDQVVFNKTAADDIGTIVTIEPRKNYIIRKSINLSKQAHILAANIDQAILMVTLAMPKTFPEFIDRFLVSAEAYSIPAIIIFNKIDLHDEPTNETLEQMISVYTGIGYPCYTISAKQKNGLETIWKLLENKISVVAGHSGIGKSTLINALEPSLQLKTKEISTFHNSGMHTTTYPEMYALSNGGYIIDTPGIKGFGIIDMEKDEISHYFPEIFKLSENCEFYNCTHSHEPRCAIKKAVEEGVINQTRYKSYLNLFYGDEEEKYRMVSY